MVYFETLGSTVFAYCRHCEHRRWESAKGELDLNTILDAAGQIRPSRARA